MHFGTLRNHLKRYVWATRKPSIYPIALLAPTIAPARLSQLQTRRTVAELPFFLGRLWPLVEPGGATLGLSPEACPFERVGGPPLTGVYVNKFESANPKRALVVTHETSESPFTISAVSFSYP